MPLSSPKAVANSVVDGFVCFSEIICRTPATACALQTVQSTVSQNARCRDILTDGENQEIDPARLFGAAMADDEEDSEESDDGIDDSDSDRDLSSCVE